MQKCPIYLYSNSLDVIVDLDQNALDQNLRIHNIMYQRDLKIQKGLKNRVQLQFKNSDQKRVNISTGTFIFSMFDDASQLEIVKKIIEVTDDGVTTSTRGVGVLTLNEKDTSDLDTGFYHFSITSLDNEGNYIPTYANTYYSAAGVLELRQDAFPVLKPSAEVSNFQLNYNHETFRYEYFSDKIDATPENTNNVAAATFAFYMNNYTGTIEVQGTLDNSPEPFGNYATVRVLNYTNYTGVDYFAFNGLFTWVRTKHIPAVDPIYNTNDHTTDSYHGTVDKILYRN